MRPYVVGSGWYCDGSGKHEGSTQKHMKSADEIRKEGFHHVWYHFVNKYTNPAKIFIVDSSSPIKPPINPNDSRIEYVDLHHNLGHAVTADKELSMSGWERAVQMGALYALLNEMDFVYVEQDCIVSGEGWVDICRQQMTKRKIMFGNGVGTPQRLQQCLFILDLEFIPDFLQISLNPKTGGVKRDKNRKRLQYENPETRWHRYFRSKANMIPFGSGRARPIPMDETYFYAQQFTEDEIVQICNLEGIPGIETNS